MTLSGFGRSYLRLRSDGSPRVSVINIHVSPASYTFTGYGQNIGLWQLRMPRPPVPAFLRFTPGSGSHVYRPSFGFLVGSVSTGFSLLGQQLRAFLGHPWLLLHIPSCQGYGRIFTDLLIHMPGTPLRSGVCAHPPLRVNKIGTSPGSPRPQHPDETFTSTGGGRLQNP